MSGNFLQSFFEPPSNMQGLGGTSGRASGPALPLRSVDSDQHQLSTFLKQLLAHSAYWVKRLRHLVILASIIFLIRLFHDTRSCNLQRESVGQLHRYHTPWNRVASTMNQPLPSISGVLSISCEASLCFDEGIGARIINNEITHLTNIVNLVDGCGRPFDEIFDPDSR